MVLFNNEELHRDDEEIEHGEDAGVHEGHEFQRQEGRRHREREHGMLRHEEFPPDEHLVAVGQKTDEAEAAPDLRERGMVPAERCRLGRVDVPVAHVAEAHTEDGVAVEVFHGTAPEAETDAVLVRRRHTVQRILHELLDLREHEEESQENDGEDGADILPVPFVEDEVDDDEDQELKAAEDETAAGTEHDHGTVREKGQQDIPELPRGHIEREGHRHHDERTRVVPPLEVQDARVFDELGPALDIAFQCRQDEEQHEPAGDLGDALVDACRVVLPRPEMVVIEKIHDDDHEAEGEHIDERRRAEVGLHRDGADAAEEVRDGHEDHRQEQSTRSLHLRLVPFPVEDVVEQDGEDRERRDRCQCHVVPEGVVRLDAEGRDEHDRQEHGDDVIRQDEHKTRDDRQQEGAGNDPVEADDSDRVEHDQCAEIVAGKKPAQFVELRGVCRVAQLRNDVGHNLVPLY